MKLQLNKKKLKNLSKDAQVLPSDMTPQVGGGGVTTNTTYDGGGSNGTTDTSAGAPSNPCDSYVTGSCGCDSAGGACTITVTCM